MAIKANTAKPNLSFRASGGVADMVLKMKRDKKQKADAGPSGGRVSRRLVVRCTLAEMIENDVLDHGIGGKNTTDGFTIGSRGKAKFYMYDPTPNGYYKIYEQGERGEIVGVRYVDADKTIVSVWGRPEQHA
jgi:hypothetical protein